MTLAKRGLSGRRFRPELLDPDVGGGLHVAHGVGGVNLQVVGPQAGINVDASEIKLAITATHHYKDCQVRLQRLKGRRIKQWTPP